jgi:hypothetical protein
MWLHHIYVLNTYVSSKFPIGAMRSIKWRRFFALKARQSSICRCHVEGICDRSGGDPLNFPYNRRCFGLFRECIVFWLPLTNFSRPLNRLKPYMPFSFQEKWRSFISSSILIDTLTHTSASFFPSLSLFVKSLWLLSSATLCEVWCWWYSLLVQWMEYIGFANWNCGNH